MEEMIPTLKLVIRAVRSGALHVHFMMACPQAESHKNSIKLLFLSLKSSKCNRSVYEQVYFSYCIIVEVYSAMCRYTTSKGQRANTKKTVGQRAWTLQEDTSECAGEAIGLAVDTMQAFNLV